MRKILAIALCIILLAAPAAHGQDRSPYSSKWVARPAVGYYFPTTRLLQGAITDDLIEYDDRSFYWQVFAGAWFFHKHWGVEFNYQAGSSTHIPKRAGRFHQAVRDQYGNDFIVTPSTGGEYLSFNPILGHIERGFLGVVYRLEARRFLFYPKLSLGISSFYTDWGRAYLKEKNANNVYDVFYSTEARPNDHFTVAATGTIGYRLGKQVYLAIDLQGSRYKTGIIYTKTTTNLSTGAKETEDFDYSKLMLNLAVGGGLVIML